MKVLLVSGLVGLIIGFAAQRSRFCLIGGVRDYMIVRDKYLLKGLYSLIITAALLFFLFGTTGKFKDNMPNYPQFMAGTSSSEQAYSTCACTDSAKFVVKTESGVKVDFSAIKMDHLMIATLCGAFLIGLVSVLIGGCPLRQHVKAASGNKSALVYLLGFYAAVAIYQFWLVAPVTKFFSEG